MKVPHGKKKRKQTKKEKRINRKDSWWSTEANYPSNGFTTPGIEGPKANLLITWLICIIYIAK